MDKNTSNRRKFVRGTGAAIAGALTLGTGTASARLSNWEVREKVKKDFKCWNNTNVSMKTLNDVYHPWWSWNATRFAGPSFAGVAALLSGAKRPYLWRHEYKAMVEIIRRAVEPVGDKLIREKSFSRGKQPRSGGKWVMEGRINGRYFEQEATGRHWWAGEKVTLVKVWGFDFLDILKQIL